MKANIAIVDGALQERVIESLIRAGWEVLGAEDQTRLLMHMRKHSDADFYLIDGSLPQMNIDIMPKFIRQKSPGARFWMTNREPLKIQLIDLIEVVKVDEFHQYAELPKQLRRLGLILK